MNQDSSTESYEGLRKKELPTMSRCLLPAAREPHQAPTRTKQVRMGFRMKQCLLRARLTVLAVLSTIASLAQNDPAATARTPSDELASFRLADPQLAIELLLSEPAVISPVCVAW